MSCVLTVHEKSNHAFKDMKEINYKLKNLFLLLHFQQYEQIF